MRSFAAPRFLSGFTLSALVSSAAADWLAHGLHDSRALLPTMTVRAFIRYRTLLVCDFQSSRLFPTSAVSPKTAAREAGSRLRSKSQAVQHGTPEAWLTSAGIKAPCDAFSHEFAMPLMDGHWPTCPAPYAFRSGSGPSARTFAPRFFQTLRRWSALALRYEFTSIRLSRGLSPPSRRTCSAHKQNGREMNSRPSGFEGDTGYAASARNWSGMSELSNSWRSAASWHLIQ